MPLIHTITEKLRSRRALIHLATHEIQEVETFFHRGLYLKSGELISSNKNSSSPSYYIEACAINNISIGGLKDCAKAVKDATTCSVAIGLALPTLLLSFDSYKASLSLYSNIVPIPQCIKDICLLYTSPSPRDQRGSRMPSSA